MIPKTIVIHHSDSIGSTSITDIDKWHRLRGFPKSSLDFYVGYHYVILSNGTYVQTRKDNEIGYHCIPNDGKIGICLVGDFTLHEPGMVQLYTLQNLLLKLKYEFKIPFVFGHRDFNVTECPGNNLYLSVMIDKLNWAQKFLKFLRSKL